MKVILIDAASAAQLANFASVHLGLAGVHANAGRDKIIEQMRDAGYEADTIEILEAESKAKAKKADATPLDPKRMVTIHIASSEGPGGNRPVEVAVNGSLMLIPRGKDVEIPWTYLHVLQNAKTAQAEVDEDGQVIGWRSAPAYPVSVLHQ